MTLQEIGREYAQTAERVRKRLRTLRQAAKDTDDPEALWQMYQEIRVLSAMLTQCNELAGLCTHYYEKGYHRSERYCF